jgi:hypothetical protein
MKTKNYFLLIAGIILSISACKKDKEEDPVPPVGNQTEHHTLTFQPNATEGKDAVFCLLVPDNNYGNVDDINLYAWTQSGNLNVKRTTIEFNLSSIPAGAVIDSAFLSLYYNTTSIYSSYTGPAAFWIRRITSPWDEATVTWTTQPTFTSTNQVSVPQGASPTQDYPNINVTQLVKDMIANADSHGFMIMFQDETPYKIILFASSDHANSALHPKLVVHYTVN